MTLRPPATSASGAGPSLQGWPVLRLGFRPFYLGAALFGALSVPAWIAVFLGVIGLNATTGPLYWHAHEMLFGFAAAPIAGFLLTAGKAWTGLPTLRGPWLGALAGLWLAARLAALGAPYVVYAALDVLLLPIVAAVLLNVLVRARNRRNLPLVTILALLSLANLVSHLAMTGTLDVLPMRALHAGLGLIVMIECVIAGRVIPFFTASATPGLELRVHRSLEVASLSAAALALAWWVFAPPGALGAVLFGSAAVLHALRQLQWRPLVTRDRPILWILHAAYAWIPVGFALLAFAQAGAVSPSAGVHALAVGATGGLIIGMITRTARGHTGRPLRASPVEVLAYALVMAAAALRVAGPLIAPDRFVVTLVAAALAWSAAFAIYLCVFAPWLVSARADGKDG